MTATAAAIAKRRATGEREANDFYRTPPYCTEALLRVETMPAGTLWEPACGDGAISKVLEAAGHPVLATDLICRGYGEARRDFLFEQALPAGVAGVVTNPPFKLAAEFVLHAKRLGAPYIAMLLRLAWLEGEARHKAVFTPYPPSRVWVFRRRPTLWRGDETPNGSGSIAYAWFVWDDQAPQTTQLGWI